MARWLSSTVITNCINGTVRVCPTTRGHMYVEERPDQSPEAKWQPRVTTNVGRTYRYLRLRHRRGTMSKAVSCGSLSRGSPFPRDCGAWSLKLSYNETTKGTRTYTVLSVLYDGLDRLCHTSKLLTVHSVAFSILRRSSIRTTSETTAPVNSARDVILWNDGAV